MDALVKTEVNFAQHNAQPSVTGEASVQNDPSTCVFAVGIRQSKTKSAKTTAGIHLNTE